MKFRERFMMGEVPFDDIFSLTDKWNFSDEDCTLREYLGLTAKEEDIWISDSDDALEELLEQEKRTKAVFLDLDGTLFTDAKTFSDGNRQAIEQALEAGHQIVISTGRPLASAKMQAKELGFIRKGCFVISFNGGEIYDMYRKKSIFKKPLSMPLVRHIFDEAHRLGLHCQTYSDSEILTEHDTEEVKRYSSITRLPYRVVPDVTAALKSEPVKVLVVDYDNREHLVDYQEKTNEWAEGKADRFFSSNEYLEHVAPGISKGAAVAFLCEYTGIPLCNTVAAGDAENDISMIKAAHIGCAMKNAEENVKKAADYITENDNNHDGVAEIIRKFILA